MRHVALALVAVLMLAGCASAPDPCGDPIRVPVPYWDPPQDLPTLDPPPTPTATYFHCPPEVTAERCAELELEQLLAAALELLADSEYCRHQYSEVVRFVESVPPVVPPPLGGLAPAPTD